MNKRQHKKQLKKEKTLICTGGFLTPYMCPTCKIRFTYRTAYYITECPNCKQRVKLREEDDIGK